jgi:hypothetical protein
MPIILKRRRGHRRITEAWVPIDVRRTSRRDVATCSLDAIVIAALRNIGVSGRWRTIDNRVWMRTPGNGERERQYGKCHQFAHG